MPGVTEEQIIAARRMTAIEFLQLYRPGELVKAESRGEFQLRAHDSFKINEETSLWHWKSRDVGGKSALDYLIKVEGMKFVEAVQALCEESPSYIPPPSQPEQPKEFLLPPAAENNRRVFAYLLKRGIDRKVIEACVRAGILYESADYHNAVFVGKDECGTARYAFLRGTYTKGKPFKAEVSGSNKRFCFSIDGQNDSKLNVFECAIDALSYLTQVKMQGADWRQESVLSLGGVYQSRPNETPKVPTALQGDLERYAGVQEIVLRLDNDAVGRGAASAISQAISDLPVSVELPAEGKDYNEWLMRQKGISPRQRARNEPER